MTCKGYRERKECLNRKLLGLGDKVEMIASPVDDVRRSMMKWMAIAPFTLKNNILKATWHVVGAEPPLEIWAVKGFIRTALTIQRVHYQKNGHHMDKDSMLNEVAKNSHFDPDDPAYAWASVLRPGAKEEILPGWKLDFALIADGYPRAIAGEMNNDGFRMILKSDDITLITDEGVLAIYEAPTRESNPPARLLDRAEVYPGASFELPVNEKP
jgi:hypothetical protein